MPKPTVKRQIYDEQLFRLLIEQSTDAIQLVSADGHLLFSSDSVVNVLGYTPAEIFGMDISPYLHPDDAPGFAKRWQKLIKKPKAHDNLEYRVRHKDGSWVWVEATITNHLETPGIEAVVGNFRSITERKATEEKLRQSEAQYRLLSDFSPVAIAVHAEGTILYVNKTAADVVGAKSPKELIGQPIGRFVHPDFREMVRQRVIQILRDNKPTPLVQERFMKLDGTPIDVEVISLPVYYDGKRAIQVVIQDITEKKKAAEALERELRLEKETLRLTKQHEEMVALGQAKDEFIALASHQLRTPATAVKQYLYMLLEGYMGDLTEQQREALMKANTSNDRQINIINDLLEVARLDGGNVELNKEKIDIGTILNLALEELKTEFGKRKQTVTMSIPKEHAEIVVDPTKIRMALENLLSNASKYSEMGKTIAVSLSRRKHSYCIAVKDEGVGIGKDEIEKLFKKFSRIDNPLSILVGGSGLGLYWANKIVHMHGGKIEVKSAPHKGSTFTIVLPAGS